jgi:hypothetical protein
MTMQLIPQFDPLLSSLPVGREFHKPQRFAVPVLGEDVLVQMRAPPEYSESFAYKDDEDSQSDPDMEDPVGAFPGTANSYAASSY